MKLIQQSLFFPFVVELCPFVFSIWLLVSTYQLVVNRCLTTISTQYPLPSLLHAVTVKMNHMLATWELYTCSVCVNVSGIRFAVSESHMAPV